MIFKIYLFLCLINAVTYANENENKETEEVVDNRPAYSTPNSPENAYLAENFDSNSALNSWTVSKAKKDGVDEEIAKYDGKWLVESQESNSLAGDMGLVLKSKAKHHAISTKLLQPFVFESASQFVLQYEVNFQKGIECGGGYIKLLTLTDDLKLETFHDKTPYTIMFGPDKCGEDYKLHFIFRHKNPITGEFEEKHAKKTTSDLKGPYGDKGSHLYTLVLNDDNSFVIYLDQKEINRGNLLQDMSPAVNPPKEIEDKDDKKPEDWDEREKIPDPEASKPDDWDEDAPATIPDPDAEMPDGWLEDEPLYVDDPEAERPEDWDDDMDGEWEPPKIENPKCSAGPGCGTWEPPTISNPAYKGKWRPPLIANPKYKGIWKPRMIPNPNFFEDKNPYKMTTIGAVGLELWSMSEDIIFDNILIVDNKALADAYADQTWKLKRMVHSSNEPGFFQSLIDATNERPWLWAIYILVVGLPLVLIFTFCCSGKSKSDPKKTDEPQPDDPHTEDENEDGETKEDNKTEEDDKDASGDSNKIESKAALEEDEEEEEEKPSQEKDGSQEEASQEEGSQDEGTPRRSTRKRKPRKD